MVVGIFPLHSDSHRQCGFIWGIEMSIEKFITYIIDFKTRVLIFFLSVLSVHDLNRSTNAQLGRPRYNIYNVRENVSSKWKIFWGSMSMFHVNWTSWTLVVILKKKKNCNGFPVNPVTILFSLLSTSHLRIIHRLQSHAKLHTVWFIHDG